MAIGFGKRIEGLHGQRQEQRNPALVPVVCTTLYQSGLAALTNLSQTGAKLAELKFGREGEEALIQVAGLTLMGTIRWVRDMTCGVEFDAPLGETEVEHLRAESILIPRSLMTPEEQLAANDWQTGWVT